MSWLTYKLGEVLERKRVNVHLEADSSYKLVTIKLHHQGVVLRQIMKGDEIKSNMFRVNEGDFVLSGIDARNGAFGIVPKELEGAIITNDFWCLVPKPEILRKDFFLFLTTTSFFDFICKQCSDGTTQRIRLQKDKFYNYEIFLPAIDEQEKVVKSLSFTKNKKEELSSVLTHQLDLVKQLRQSFLHEAMQGKLTAHWRNENPDVEPASELLKKIIDEKEKLHKEGKLKKQKPLPPIKNDEMPFEIPESWVWCRLGEVVNIKSGKRIHESDYRKDGIPFLRSGEISTLGRGEKLSSQLYISESQYNEIKNKFGIPKKGDILIACIGGSIGNTWVVDEREFYYKDGNLVLIESNPEVLYMYLLSYLKSSFFWKNTILNATDSSYNALTIIKLNNSELPLPPLSEQQQIVAKLDKLMQFCDNLEEIIETSQQQNEMLLQQVLREALEPETKEIEDRKVIKFQTRKCNSSEKAILAGHIINQTNADDFGRVKFQKLLYLAEHHLKLDLDSNYKKKVAGPHDGNLLREIESTLERLRYYRIEQSHLKNHRVNYTALNYASELDNLFIENFEVESKGVDAFLSKFKKSTWEQCEIIATMYAVWNNRIIKNQPISDDLLKQDFLNWDKQKIKYKDRLDGALVWMRKDGIVPDGWGKLIDKPK